MVSEMSWRGLGGRPQTIRKCGMEDEVLTTRRFTSILHRALLIGSAILFFCWHASAAEPLRLIPNEPATEHSSYEAGRNRRGVQDADPNIYVYTPEFARRFQMPMQWASDDLKGADAVAFRVMPYYKSCGWGGDPKACREDEVRCHMDVYFDHKKNPLPWDERMRPTDLDSDITSQWFIGNIANRKMRPQTTLLGGPPLPRSPFTDPKTGKELGWQSSNTISVGWTGIRSYDREIFHGFSLVTFGVACGVPRAAWLASVGIEESDARSGKGVFTYVSTPPSWQDRVKQVLAESTQRSNAFFKQQGEKALKDLQVQPVPSKTITPIQ